MINFIKYEIAHFKNLPKKAQRLLISFFFYSTAYPMISVFVSAFIWEKNNDISSLIFFRAGQFFVVPIAFLLGGLLLKIVKINRLYFIGSIFVAISSILIIFLKNETVVEFLLMGALMGIGTGIYWVNRNYLTQKETTEENRNYFFGLYFSFSTLLGLAVTLAVGWLIVFGISYQFLMTVAFILIIFSGLTVLKMDVESPKIGKLFINDSSYIWMKKRFIHLGIGLVEGISFVIPGLLILTVLGNEGVLGTLTAISSIISTILMYIYGRKSHTGDHRNYFVASTILALLVSLLMAFSFNKFTVIIYTLLNSLVINFLWLTVAPLVLKNVDLEVGEIEDRRFSYVLDSELFLNIGRLLSLFVCLIIANYIGVAASLRFSPIVLSAFQVILFGILQKKRLGV